MWLIDLVRVHDVVIGLVGTFVVILAIVAGYGRRHEIAMRNKPRQKSRADVSGC